MSTERAFWDASAVVPLCCHQASSPELHRLGRRLKRMVVWWATMIEAYSAFSRLMRGEKLTSSGRRQAIARLETLRRAWIEVLPSERVLEIAITLPERHELRALDSLQLASALVWCREKPRARLFVCCDERLATTAAKVGFEVLP